MRIKLVALILGAALAGGSVVAAEPSASGVKGKFSSDSVTLDARSAIAFKGKSSLGDDDAIGALHEPRTIRPP